VKRGVIDTLRRGAESAIANWQLSLIRFGEVMLFSIIAIGAIIALLVPIFVSIGISLSNITRPDQLESMILTLREKWTLFLWFGLGVIVMLIVFLIIHSFIAAGCARVFVDADRAAGPAATGARGRFRFFSADRWVAGAKEGGWTVFWIYNLAWSVAALILLIPALLILASMLIFRDNPTAMAGVGCLGMMVILLLGIVVGFVAGMWTNRAIADWAAQRLDARAAVRSGWRAVRTDLGRHLLVALAIIVIAMAGSSFFASFSMFAAFGDSVGRNAPFNMITMPIRLIGTILSWGFSSLIASWYLASYAALAVESKP
jgi:hypothetical protein